MSIPSKCPECGSIAIIQFEEPGYDPDGFSVLDWSCDHCGFSGFDTAEQQEDDFRKVRDEGKAYQDDTGFAKPWKPTVKIPPENLERKRRVLDVEPEVIVNGWVCRAIDKDSLTCPVCKGTIPIANVPNGDCWYEPDWAHDLFRELEPTILQAFKVKDVLDEFVGVHGHRPI